MKSNHPTKPTLRNSVLAMALLAFPGLGLPTAANAAVIYTNGDSVVNSEEPTTNYGTSELLNVSNITFLSGAEVRTYLSFDVTDAVPAGFAFQSANLVLYFASYAGAPPVNVYEVTGPWTEADITWDNQPTYASTALDTGAYGLTEMQWDVSGAWPGTGTMDLVLTMPHSWDAVYYFSKDQLEFSHPRLDITVTAVPEVDSSLALLAFLAVPCLTMRWRGCRPSS